MGNRLSLYLDDLWRSWFGNPPRQPPMSTFEVALHARAEAIGAQEMAQHATNLAVKLDGRVTMIEHEMAAAAAGLGVPVLVANPVTASAPRMNAMQIRQSFLQDVEEFQERARQKRGIDSKQNFNVGIAGDSGSGKSQLTNAIRRVLPQDPEAAPVGEGETTHHVQMYSFDEFPRLKIWDFPGQNTITHPAPTYFMDEGLYALDALVIVFKSRLTAPTCELIRACLTFKLEVVVVRSHADVDIANMKRRGALENDAIHHLRNLMHKELQRDLGKDVANRVPAFLVSMQDYADDVPRCDEIKFVNYLLMTLGKRASDTTTPDKEEEKAVTGESF